MKRLLLLFFLCMTCHSAFSQNGKVSFYIFNNEWGPAKDYESSSYIMQQIKENDSFYVCRYYTKTGPMVKWESYKDSKRKMPHGLFVYYNEKGRVDSFGSIYNGVRDSYWYYQNDTGRLITKRKYNVGELVKSIDYINKEIKYADGTIKNLEDPSQKDTANKKEKDTSSIADAAAEFKGGIRSWLQYLQKNLKTPERFITIHKNSSYRGTVIVSFIVDKEGNLNDFLIEKSCDWSTDTEALRVFKTSPQWKPAFQNGKAVTYRHRQSISFLVSD